jgi:uncharacterized membrane-anchored protein YjiN (DUF445 family)
MSLAPPGPDDPRRAGLRRMRIIATALLALMTVLFIATWLVPQDLPALDYIRAFAEAGMVGACADWFAVVALFRHPFGIPIPHTAIVPHNQVRIAGAMGRFITNNFLAPRVLNERFAVLKPTGWASDWLAAPGNPHRAARVVATTVLEVARLAPREELADSLGRALRSGLDALPAAPLAARLLAIAWAQGQTQKLIEAGLKAIRATLLENQDKIRAKVEAGSSRWVPRWVDGVVTGRIVNATSETLDEMLDPGHPWRLELQTTVETLIERLNNDPAMAAQADEIKQRILGDPLFHEQFVALWREIGRTVPDDLSSYGPQIQSLVEQALTGFGRWLREDTARQDRIDRWIRYAFRHAVTSRRQEIGTFVTTVVERWDSATLVERMELQVGRDLQYIRINGTLVGGTVGVLIHAAVQMFAGG